MRFLAAALAVTMFAAVSGPATKKKWQPNENDTLTDVFMKKELSRGQAGVSSTSGARSAELPKGGGATGARNAELGPQYKIAIIDTGYDPQRATEKLKICKDGHYDYHTNTPNLGFIDGHGTFVANLIAEKLSKVDYCAEIYEVFADATTMHASDLAEAIDRAIRAGVIAINISLGSDYLDSVSVESAMEQASDLGILVFVAAGNHGTDLDKNCWIYPACFKLKGEIVVGAQDPTDPKEHAIDSNYGKKTVSIFAPGWYDDGENQDFGTSYAATRALAEYVLFLDHKRTKITQGLN